MRFYQGNAIPYRTLSRLCHFAGMVLVFLGMLLMSAGVYVYFASAVLGTK